MKNLNDLLSKINGIDDLRNLEISQLEKLSDEIRHFLITNVSKTGGHLASNLGVVELTLALHKSFNSPNDKIIWDVGHQSYVHKIITGRKDRFHSLRKYSGLSGFPKRSESSHDIFETGHSSTSISAGLGIALARDLNKEDYNVISVIGDGAMTAGMAYEALNHAGHLGTKMIVILNDNEMSISKNVGGLSRYLNKIRTAKTYSKVKDDIETLLNHIPCIGKTIAKTAERLKDTFKFLLVPGSFFEELGYKYLGPVDGHDFEALLNILNMAKKVKGPVIIHTITKKGKGYIHAEEKPDKFHGTPPFDISTGNPISKSTSLKYSDVFGNTLLNLATKNKKIATITAAMPSGTGLGKFKEKFPDRFFDVGIAEQHGVTLAAGLAAEGIKPFYAVYSTFLQRGYDQLLHDVCIQKLPVVFAIDRAGIVGSDGETHQGVFDLSYLTHIPNLTVMAPKDKIEFEKMIEFTSSYNKPAAIRYPRGYCSDLSNISKSYDICIGKAEILNKGNDIAIIAIGKMVSIAYEVYKDLLKENINITLINARFAKPLDEELILEIANSHKYILTLEDNVRIGGFGSLVNNLLIDNNYRGKIFNIGYPDEFIEHGSIDKLLANYNMDTHSLIKFIKNKVYNKKSYKKSIG